MHSTAIRLPGRCFRCGWLLWPSATGTNWGMRLKGAITFCKFRFNQFHFNNWYFLSAMDTGMAEWRLDKNITLQEGQWWPPGNTTGIHCKMSIGMIGRQQVWKIVLICAFTRVQVIYMMFVTTATHCHTATLCPPFCAVCDSPCNSSPFRIKFCILFQRALCPIDCTGSHRNLILGSAGIPFCNKYWWWWSIAMKC